MGIPIERAERHIVEQSRKLRSFPQNRNWPRYLFHAAQAEVVCKIVKTGKLIPRASQEKMLHDVANPGAIAAKTEARKHVRFYFRPKNDFHMRTEGIKCLGDPYRLEKQMSVPVMMVFDAKEILTIDETGFTAGCLASAEATPEFSATFFDEIPFDDVYHDRAPSRERMREVHFHRMAEVIFPGEIEIGPYLRAVLCRTSLDRQTVLTTLGARAAEFQEVVRIEQIYGSCFMHRGLYITEINSNDDKIHIRLHRPHDSPPTGKIRVSIRQTIDGELVQTKSGEVSGSAHAITASGFKIYDGAIWEIDLEEVIAYRGPLLPSGSVVIP